MFKTIKENASAEIVEKKSKFIANIFYVETREEAEPPPGAAVRAPKTSTN